MSQSRIGKRCTLGQNVFVGKEVLLGDDVKVQNNVSLFEGVQCEDEVFIGPSVVFTNISNPRATVDRSEAFQPTVVEQGATIGANATIICGITVGAWSFIGAGAVVLNNIPRYALMVGNPARQIGWMSRKGHRLQFEADGTAYCEEEDRTYIREEEAVKLDNEDA